MSTCAHDGFARAIRPVHTQMDGYTYIALATGRVNATDMIQQCAARRGTARAIAKPPVRRHALIVLGIDICHVERIGKPAKGQGF